MIVLSDIHTALKKVRDDLATGAIKYLPEPVDDKGHACDLRSGFWFNMNYTFIEYVGGGVCGCMGFWTAIELYITDPVSFIKRLKLIGIEPEDAVRLQTLFHPDQGNWLKITPAQAIIAIDLYFKDGETNWREALRHEYIG